MFYKWFKISVLSSILCILVVVACQQAENAPSRASAPPPPAREQAPGQPAGSAAGKAKDEVANEAATNPNEPGAPPQAFITAAASVGRIDSFKRFIRTADLRFRTQDVLKTTLKIEDIALQNGGFVTENKLNTEINSRETKNASPDSSLEITHFTRHNTLMVRVPFRQLDTTIRAIGKLVDFLDYRYVTAQDVGLDLLVQQLEQARQRQYQQDIHKITTRPGEKAYNITDAADNLLNSRAAADQAKVDLMRIEDQIRYSTVKLDIYERSQIQYRMLGREKPVADFEPGFGSQLWIAIVSGWHVLQSILIAIVHIWSILLLLAGLYIAFRWWDKRSKG